MLVKKILKALSYAADILDIDLMLQGGTLLGYVQMEKILPWDDDVDIGIEEKNILQFLTVINNHTDVKYGCFVEERTGVEYYKFWLTSGTSILNHTYNFPFVDLWIHNIKNADILFKNGMKWPNAVLRKFKSVIFEGSEFKIPSNYMECLDTQYGTWKEYARIYTYSHKTESDIFYPLRTKILINENGKIIYPNLEKLKCFDYLVIDQFSVNKVINCLYGARRNYVSNQSIFDKFPTTARSKPIILLYISRRCPALLQGFVLFSYFLVDVSTCHSIFL